MLQLIEQNVGAWLAATLLAILTLFSDKLIGRIRLQLNRSDLRAKYFEELARDLSTYLFHAAIFEERFRKGWATDADDMDAIGGEVNAAVTELMTREYIYRSWARKYWGAAAASSLVEVLQSVRRVDDAIHEFNDRGDEGAKVAKLGRELAEARKAVESWLGSNDIQDVWAAGGGSVLLIEGDDSARVTVMSRLLRAAGRLFGAIGAQTSRGPGQMAWGFPCRSPRTS